MSELSGWMGLVNVEKKLLKRFLADMKEAGATGVITVSFSGHGDEGNLDRPTLTVEQKAAVAKLNYAFEYGSGWEYVDGKYVEIVNGAKKTLLSAISTVIPFDWQNNEGGRGIVYLDIDNNTVRVEGKAYITSYNSVNDEF